MRGVDHYKKAEVLVETADRDNDDAAAALAQVHATLALAGATALATYCRVEGSDGELADWEHAAGGEDE